MPHVIVKLWPGKTEEQKKQLAEEITKSVMRTLKYGEELCRWLSWRSSRASGPKRSISPTS